MRIISDKGFQNKKWDTTFLRKVVRNMRRFVNPGNTAFEVAVNSLLQYTGQILLIGINYDKKTKEHSCKIERFERVLQ